MKIKSILFFLLFHLICFIQYGWSLQIISPVEGEEIIAGTDVTVIVKADPGENWTIVRVGFDIMTYDSINNVYSKILHVPVQTVGPVGQLIVFAADEADNSVELQRNVIIKLPHEVNLLSIEVDPNPMFLYKLPPDSDPNKMGIFEEGNLSVAGTYSDGIDRELTMSSTGTIYSSRNVNIVTVNSEGKVTAQGLGQTNIRIVNGQYEKDITVIVKQYRQK